MIEIEAKVGLGNDHEKCQELKVFVSELHTLVLNITELPPPLYIFVMRHFSVIFRGFERNFFT